MYLQPALRRLLHTLEPLRPTFAAMLAGSFEIPWPRGSLAAPPFDPLTQPSVKRALRLRGDAALALHCMCVTAHGAIAQLDAAGQVVQSVSLREMRRIQLVRASPQWPCMLALDLVDAATGDRSTAFHVLLTGHASGDRAELAVKNSLAGVPLDVLDAPPPVRMPDLVPLLRRMRRAVEEHDALIAERSAVLERIRRLQFQSISRSAVEKYSVGPAEAPAQEMSRQCMLNLLVSYVCNANARSRGEFS